MLQSLSFRLPQQPTELQEFSSTVHAVVDNLSAQARVIETAKSRAVGLRALAEMEKSSRARALVELPNEIADRNRYVSRLQAELESLQRVESEQRDLIDKLIQ